MKHLVLKSRPLIIMAAGVFFLIGSCNKQSISPEKDKAINVVDGSAKIITIADIAMANPFNKKVGAPIDGQLGNNWIAKYKKMYGYNKTYVLSNNYLQTIINQPNCVGICLYYATDSKNKTHIIPIGIDINRKKIKCININTINGNISWETALQWIANYTGTIDAHFFGSNTFNRLNESSCETIKAEFAINDKNQPELLLSNPCSLNLTKQYEDASLKCPAYCPSN